MTRAAIDIGTQSTNLLVCDEHGAQLERIITATRLGEGLHDTGRLSGDAIARTVACTARYAERARELGARDIIVTGTAACRRAANTTELTEALAGATGLALDVLTEEQEARLAFMGATTSLGDADGPTLVVDIGGGSTELIIGFDSPEMSASIPFGAVTSSASHIRSDPPRPEDLTNLIGAVADELEEIGRAMPAIMTPSRVVGVAGTIVTVAAVEIGLARFDENVLHGFTLTKDAAEDVFRTLATESHHERVSNPGLDPQRADIIVAGCCILVAVMRRLNIDEIVVSTRNLLDGVVRHGRIDP